MIKQKSMKTNEDSAMLPRDEQNNDTPSVWDVLEERKKRGLWDGEIDTIEIKEHSLSSGKHYFIVEDASKRSIICNTCPISHGGILEAHLLHLYRLEDGILYFKGEPVNEK